MARAGVQWHSYSRLPLTALAALCQTEAPASSVESSPRPSLRSGPSRGCGAGAAPLQSVTSRAGTNCLAGAAARRAAAPALRVRLGSHLFFYETAQVFILKYGMNPVADSTRTRGYVDY